jgi:hypothetical protein
MKKGKRQPVLSYCNLCHQNTQHELRTCDGDDIGICVRCLERVLTLVRDSDSISRSD